MSSGKVHDIQRHHCWIKLHSEVKLLKFVNRSYSSYPFTHTKAGQLFALIAGLLCLVLGIASLVPTLVQAVATVPDNVAGYLTVDSYGSLFGLFPVSTGEAVLYLVFGVFGLAAATALDSARLYAGLLAVVFGSFAILGLIPFANTVFGLFSIYGNDVLLHGAIALASIYFGFFATPNLLQLLQDETEEKA